MGRAQQILDDLATLPASAQDEVADFVAFLKSRHERARARRGRKVPDLSRSAFIGLWQDRTDMEDTRAWLRGLRRREWGETQ